MPVETAAIIAAVETAIRTKKRPVPLHEPLFVGNEWENLKSCLDTGWVSTAGQFVDAFETDLAALCQTKSAVAVVNGTAALHVALRLVGVGAGDEVIVPALTFVATANAVAYCGAVPHFVDADPTHLGLDPIKLASYLGRITQRRDGVCINRGSGRTIRALLPVHVFGHPCDMDAINAVADTFGLAVVEDATESLGSLYHGKPCGGLARVGVLSFNGNKIVTTGGGGAIVTDDAEIARRARHLTTTAKVPHPFAFIHDEIGWNYRLPNLNAALGVAQIAQLAGFVTAKRRLALRYTDAFSGMDGVTLVQEPAGTVSNYWLNAILLNADSASVRDRLVEAFHDAGLLVRPVWTPMHQLEIFRDSPRDDLTATESIARRLINLPSSARLGMDDVE